MSEATARSSFIPSTVPSIDRVLAVDDTEDNLVLLETILADEGYEISLARDGLTALALVEPLTPDLILLDVMMPEMDGYEVTRRIRKNLKLPYIPILLITAHDQSSVVYGLDAGADDFIRKPFDTDELLARVRSLLRLKHSIDEREAMVRQREDFVSRLTHDLRTPLVAADRMLTLVQQEIFGPVSAEMRETLAVLMRSNQNLLQIVNTLLEVYRYESGYKALTFSPCNLWELIQEVIQELSPLAQEKGLTLGVTLQSGTETPKGNNKGQEQNNIVTGDRLELRRVLTNLIGNAIKFTDRGQIQVRLMAPIRQAASTSQPMVTLEIADTGAGIPKEDQEILFERFRQGKDRRSGSGLGLYLSRRIVEAHQGTISVTSELGQGSTFKVCLPVGPLG
ncbi:hybrid sensor histidine kinase/response regulator [Leptolyngbya sp. 'hensonii']|uniref:sensor histidine kinase n=1 Tax=Leptolyngbya sp. 'hensonii' TaxID=1922337 RepID=UPI00094F76CF|nr:HAMP domain-containing sensor histidine kinase [Leptolyngbya sp. 'hensonii']OLP17739.1 hybrid sensor histidine kinase/response regulator [Leptolyngbya sp. 'hensonii']